MVFLGNYNLVSSVLRTVWLYLQAIEDTTDKVRASGHEGS